MKLHHAYEGTLEEVKGVWTDEHPEGAVIEREFLFIEADDADHRLKNKESGAIKSSVIIEDESEMEDWEEVEREKQPWELEVENG